MSQHSTRLWLCLIAMVLLLTACGKQAAEEPSQSTSQTTDVLEEGELP